MIFDFLSKLYLATTAASIVTSVYTTTEVYLRMKKDGYKFNKNKEKGTKINGDKVLDTMWTITTHAIPVYNVGMHVYYFTHRDELYNEILHDLLASGDVIRVDAKDEKDILATERNSLEKAIEEVSEKKDTPEVNIHMDNTNTKVKQKVLKKTIKRNY